MNETQVTLEFPPVRCEMCVNPRLRSLAVVNVRFHAGGWNLCWLHFHETLRTEWKITKTQEEFVVTYIPGGEGYSCSVSQPGSIS